MVAETPMDIIPPSQDQIATGYSSPIPQPHSFSATTHLPPLSPLPSLLFGGLLGDSAEVEIAIEPEVQIIRPLLSSAHAALSTTHLSPGALLSAISERLSLIFEPPELLTRRAARTGGIMPSYPAVAACTVTARSKLARDGSPSVAYDSAQ